MNINASKRQASGVGKLCRKQVSNYEHVNGVIMDFVSNSPSLEGETYQSAKEYYQRVLQPLVKGSILLSEAVELSCKRLPEEYISQVHDGNLNQAELEEKIQEMSVRLETLYNLRQSYVSNVSSKYSSNQLLSTNTRLIHLYSSTKKDLENKLEKLMSFHAYSGSIFHEISSLQQAIQQGMELTKTSWDASAGRFIIPSQDSFSWVQIIQERWQARSETAKEQYILHLQIQFGFDENTARMIYRLKAGIDERFPELSAKDRDYLFTRILGAFNYEGFKWNETAGSLTPYFSKIDISAFSDKVITMDLKEIFLLLGFSEEEYRLLRYTIRIQHEMSVGEFKEADGLENQYDVYKLTAEEAYSRPLSEEEFNRIWNTNLARFSNKPDFTHQYITTATHLYDNYFRLANLKGLSHEHTNELSGWRGDVTKEADAKPSMVNDDYQADLDSVNIIKIMENGKISYIEASNQYYKDIASGVYSRAEKFKENVGIDYIKEEVFSSLLSEFDMFGEDKMELLKIVSPVTYNFICSLEDNRNDYKEYVPVPKD